MIGSVERVEVGMYNYRIIDPAAALVEVTLEGLLTLEEAKAACAELRGILLKLRGRRIKILVDVRRLHPVPPEVADEFRAAQRFALTQGLERAAQLVESSVILLQRSRISKEAGTDG